MNCVLFAKMIKFSVEKKNIKKVLKMGKKYWKSQGILSIRKTRYRDNTEDTVSSTVPNLTSKPKPTFHLSSEFIRHYVLPHGELIWLDGVILFSIILLLLPVFTPFGLVNYSAFHI